MPPEPRRVQGLACGRETSLREARLPLRKSSAPWRRSWRPKRRPSAKLSRTSVIQRGFRHDLAGL